MDRPIMAKENVDTLYDSMTLGSSNFMTCGIARENTILVPADVWRMNW